MRALTVTLIALQLVGSAAAQTNSGTPSSNPLYKVTIVSRSTKAINYGYLTVPTTIGFRGTPLLADARGDATVQVKRGSTVIQARFSDVPAPSRFGPQFLTYVVWAISPDGRAQNLGELSLNSSDKGKLSASTSLQSFAMIVTAEPYYSVTQPSDVVVMENFVTPTTAGKIEEVSATYELLPRKEFTYEIGGAAPAEGKAVSRNEYDSILAIYQAQNAIQIAEAENAQRYAPDRLAQARELLVQARRYPKNQSAEIIAAAREAAQVAEDSRAIAVKRAAAERTAEERSRIAEETKQAELRRNSEEAALSADARRAQPEPPPQTQAAPPPPPSAPAPARPVGEDKGHAVSQESVQALESTQALANRRGILSALQSSFETLDTPRGIVLTIPNEAASNVSLAARLQRLASAVRPYPNLRIEVEGHSADPDVAATEHRAQEVRADLIAASMRPETIVVRGYGNSRPRTSNSSPGGRAENERVEIVIAGEAIGPLPTWDRTYSLAPARR